jgi:ABC-type oligopeptide transport system substrate-binding subunit
MNYLELIPDRTYILKRQRGNKIDIIEGIFVSIVPDSSSVLMRSMTKRSLPGIYYYGFCYKEDIYYDWDKIRDDARNARHNFEQRALNQILKRLVNEEFQWL